MLAGERLQHCVLTETPPISSGTVTCGLTVGCCSCCRLPFSFSQPIFFSFCAFIYHCLDNCVLFFLPNSNFAYISFLCVFVCCVCVRECVCVFEAYLLVVLGSYCFLILSNF
jgi:undecaprenyl pyrophosphate phosphatase UppP